MQSWKDQLHEAFKSYVECVALNLRKEPLKERWSDRQIYLAHIDQTSQLRSIIERMENSVEFKNLVSSFSTALGRDPKKAVKERYVMQTFFRRSKLYLNISEGKAVSIEDFFNKLCSVFNERQIKIVSLRLVEQVYFSDDLIDFGAFRIERLSKEELDELVGNQVNSIFYPYARLDTDKLCEYWFVKEESFQKRKKESWFLIRIDWSDFFRVSRTFPDRTIQLLALFDWETQWIAKTDDIRQDTGWLRFSTPITLNISDDYFEPPSSSPDLSGLDFQPYFDAMGEEIGEAPNFAIHLEKDELERLKNIVIKTKRFLDTIDLTKCDWEFLNIAMGYLAKAFFTDGLEQLLWHMTVLDALFGERDEVISSLKRRMSNIFGKTEKEKKDIRNKVDDLYKFRSDLVHGNAFKTEVFKGHLRLARTFARDSLLWFLNLLSTIHEELKRANIPLENYPKRKDFLFLLDSEKSDLERVKILIKSLPKDFPDHS
jgi:hypothetical protein